MKVLLFGLAIILFASVCLLVMKNYYKRIMLIGRESSLIMHFTFWWWVLRFVFVLGINRAMFGLTVILR